ncbi:MAG: hypothetical protein R2873_09940 [Caldilineaceae bacterium]
MSMYNSPHPGEFIREVYLAELKISARSVVAKLKIALFIDIRTFAQWAKRRHPRNGFAFIEDAWPISRKLACHAE